MSRGTLLGAAACLWLLSSGVAAAQDVEPRRWTPFPVGTNVLGIGYAYGEGDIFFDPVLRIDDADFRIHSAIASYVHTFEFLEKATRVDAQIPFHYGRWEGSVDGVPRSLRRRGFGDPRIRLSIGLLGPPAMEREEFAEYLARQTSDTTVGLAVAVRLPLGEYKDDTLINLGQNRFRIRPQLGVLHRRGPWSYELTGSTFFFTKNDDFFNGMELEQDPLYAVQAHVVRTFTKGHWVSLGIAYGWAGETQIDGVNKDDEKGNLLLGVSFGFRVGRSQGIAVRYLAGRTRKDTGQDTDGLALSWTMRF
jgi:hypothetical protein